VPHAPRGMLRPTLYSGQSMDLNILVNSIKASSGNKFLILAVDGHIDNLVLVSYFLESCGYQVITANHGGDALALAKEYVPDLILLEVVLPDTDGLKLVTLFKQNKLTSQIPIIAVTGLAAEEDRNRIFQVGCDAYLCKPYILDDLAKTVASYLKKI
jgi:CheY-like chemotaxis protein